MSIPNSYFIYISIVICIIVFCLIIIGYIKGFLYELVSIGYTALSLALAWFISPILANSFPIINLAKLNSDYSFLSNLINLDAILNTIAYFAIIFLILKLFYWVLTLILKGLNNIPVLGNINKILGAFAGFINGLLVCLALSLLLTLPVFENGAEVRDGTILKYTNRLNTTILNYIANNIDFSNIKKQFDNFDVDGARLDFKNWLENNE